MLLSDPQRGTSRIYNYGMFSFEQEGFLLRFVRGRPIYWLKSVDSESHLRKAIADGRSVWLQEVNLTPDETVKLREFLEWNDRDANRYYEYDYFLDNCSTRIRDALDLATAGQIKAQSTELTAATFRSRTLEAVPRSPWVYAGMTLALGRPADRRLSEWDEMFAPLSMRERMSHITLVDDSGFERPLVRSETTLAEGSFEVTPQMNGNSQSIWHLFGAGLAVLVISIGGFASRGRSGLLLARIVVGFWILLIGTAGAALMLLWVQTNHWATAWNENLLFLNPLAVPLAVVFPLSLLRVPWAARIAVPLVVAIAVGSLCGLLLYVAATDSQANAPVVGLLTVPNAAMVWLIWQITDGGKAHECRPRLQLRFPAASYSPERGESPGQ